MTAAAWCPRCGARVCAAGHAPCTCASCGHVWAGAPTVPKPRAPGDRFERFIERELAGLGLTADDVRAWRLKGGAS